MEESFSVLTDNPITGAGLRALFVTSKIVRKPILFQFSRLQKCTYNEIGLNSVVRNICRLVQLRWSPTDSEFLMKERVDIVSKILPRYLNLSCEKNIRHKLLFKVEQFTYILKRVWRVGIFYFQFPPLRVSGFLNGFLVICLI